MTAVEERVLIVSSDGHASARMRDFRPYLDSAWHAEFDEFVKEYEQVGSHTFDAKAMLRRCDPETVQKWQKEMLETDRVAGYADPARRIAEMESEGVSAE